MKEERDFFTSTPIPSFLNPKISFFIGKGGGSACVERDITLEGSREQT